jgi:hypothetical protein
MPEDKTEEILSQLEALLLGDDDDATNDDDSKDNNGADGGDTGGDSVDVEALKSENERLKAQVAEYEESAQGLLDTRLSGLSKDKKEKVQGMFTRLKMENPLQQLTVLNTFKAETRTKPSADNARTSQSGPSSKPKNPKELRARFREIMRNNAQK